MLEAQGVGFHYHRGRIVLRDIFFTLPAGRVMCLLGPNGTNLTDRKSVV